MQVLEARIRKDPLAYESDFRVQYNNLCGKLSAVGATTGSRTSTSGNGNGCISLQEILMFAVRLYRFFPHLHSHLQLEQTLMSSITRLLSSTGSNSSSSSSSAAAAVPSSVVNLLSSLIAALMTLVRKSSSGSFVDVLEILLNVVAVVDDVKLRTTIISSIAAEMQHRYKGSHSAQKNGKKQEKLVG
jgi:hypothetical protein